VKVSLDTNLRLKLWTLARARAVMSEVIGLADICLPSLEDIVAITGIEDPDKLVDHCLTLGAKVVALKLGAAGALVADANQRHRIAPHPCQPVDATGRLRPPCRRRAMVLSRRYPGPATFWPRCERADDA
jgi:2-dehydro-3-deoxygluconokinase